MIELELWIKGPPTKLLTQVSLTRVPTIGERVFISAGQYEGAYHVVDVAHRDAHTSDRPPVIYAMKVL